MIVRREIVLCIILSIITCGIYSIYWYVCLTNDLETVSQRNGMTFLGKSGGMVFLLTLITCGIYGLFWAFKCGETIDNIKQRKGMAASNGGILYLILYIFGGVIAYALIQNELNNLGE